jgi:hypothetical protein
MAPFGHGECFSSEIVEFVDGGEGVGSDDIAIVHYYLAGYIYLVDLSESLPATAGGEAASHDVERELCYAVFLGISGEY